METAKKRFRPAALGAATAVALVAGFLSVVPATAASATTDYTQPCAEPVALDGAAAQALYERVGNLGTDELASELLCFTTAGSSAKPGGTLQAQLRPIYSGTTVGYPTVNWVDSKGTVLFGATSAQDATGGWTAKLKLTEKESGKGIHAVFSDISAELPLQYETSVPDLWDNLCLEELNPAPVEETPAPEPTDGESPSTPVVEPTDPITTPAIDKSVCLVEAGYTELTDQVLRVQGASFQGTDQIVGYVPVKLGAVSISGTALVTSTLSSKIAAGTKAQKVSYQWLRNGKAISKATGTKYKLVDADRSARISLRVSASSPGQGTVVRDSNRTGAIYGKLRAPNPRVGLKGGRISCPQWNCTAVIQSKVDADRGTKMQYQWYRNGKAIKSANKSTLTVKFKYSKKAKYDVKYTLKATASRPGYRTESQSSTTTPQAWVKLPK